MASKPPRKQPPKRSAAAPEDVEAFLAALDHPLKPEILALRRIILGADPSIAEGIKWGAPSFRTFEYFATFHLRTQDAVQIILHVGGKKRDSSTARDTVADPASLLEWLGTDRATVKFTDLKDIKAKQTAFAEILRQWLKRL